MTPDVLSRAIGITIERAAKWAPHITEAMSRYDIHSPNEQASFLAQVAHESALLSMLVENLNYSADGLARTWPSRFAKPDKTPNIKALELARKPEAIANNVYANRMGNGPESSGDGWKYRGRGLIQITGKQNYVDCGRDIGVSFSTNPDLLMVPQYAALSAGWFWKVRGLDRFDDDMDVTAETRIINGGITGLKDRQALFNKAIKVLA